MQKNRTQRAFSAGGVVFRRGHAVPPGPVDQSSPPSPSKPDEIEVVLVGRSPSGIWALPKGTPRKGETVEQVALREVNEETGLQVRILSNIGSIHYSFVRSNMRYEKEVRYFLMEPAGGDIALHDTEYDQVCWFPLSEAYQRLTYESDSHILRQAEALIRKSSFQRRKRLVPQ